MAKDPKIVANYRRGTKAEHCGLCTMFRPPHGCTAVAGLIYAEDTCDYFEKEKGAAAA